MHHWFYQICTSGLHGKCAEETVSCPIELQPDAVEEPQGMSRNSSQKASSKDESFLCTVLINHCMTMNKGNVRRLALINSTEKGKAVGNSNCLCLRKRSQLNTDSNRSTAAVQLWRTAHRVLRSPKSHQSTQAAPRAPQWFPPAHP